MNSVLSRRQTMQRAGVVLAGLACGHPLAALGAVNAKPAVRFGLITDVHYADRPSRGARHYRDSTGKMKVAVDAFNQQAVDFVVECGDFIDAGDGTVESELSNLVTIESLYSQLKCPRYYVLGNHCLHTLTKQEFAEHTAMTWPHVSFDRGGWHFVILDACFNRRGKPYQRKNFQWTDTNIPQDQVDWLTADLAATTLPTVVMVHQRLDPKKHYTIRNHEQVRSVLERAGNVAAVLQGHSHSNNHQVINGIHYCVARAMVEGAGLDHSGFGVVSAYADGSLHIEGSLLQASYDWAGA